MQVLMRTRLLQLPFFLKAPCGRMVGVELQSRLNFHARVEEQAFLKELLSASNNLLNSSGSLVYAERGMQIIEEGLYREILVVDERCLEQETASFRRLPFGDPFASGIEKLLNCLSLKLGPDWLEIEQKLFHGLGASRNVFAQGALDDRFEVGRDIPGRLRGAMAAGRPECCGSELHGFRL